MNTELDLLQVLLKYMVSYASYHTNDKLGLLITTKCSCFCIRCYCRGYITVKQWKTYVIIYVQKVLSVQSTAYTSAYNNLIFYAAWETRQIVFFCLLWDCINHGISLIKVLILLIQLVYTGPLQY